MNLRISSRGSQDGSDWFITCYWVLEKIWSWEHFNTFYMGWFIIRILATSCSRSLGRSTHILVVSGFPIFDWLMSELQWYRSPGRYDTDFGLEVVIVVLVLTDEFQADEEYNQKEQDQNRNCNIQTVEAWRLHERRGREPQETWPVYLMLLQRCVQNADWTSPKSLQIPGTNVTWSSTCKLVFELWGYHSLPL